jgi:hypothetical protein
MKLPSIKLVRVDKATREGESTDVESNSADKQSSIEGVISGVAPQSRRVEVMNDGSESSRKGDSGVEWF